MIVLFAKLRFLRLIKLRLLDDINPLPSANPSLPFISVSFALNVEDVVASKENCKFLYSIMIHWSLPSHQALFFLLAQTALFLETFLHHIVFESTCSMLMNRNPTSSEASLQESFLSKGIKALYKRRMQDTEILQTL